MSLSLPNAVTLHVTIVNLKEYGAVDLINVVIGPYRSDRIGKLLSGNNAIEREDMYKIQYDVYSSFYPERGDESVFTRAITRN